MGFKSLGDVAKNILQQITAELLNMAIRAMIIKPLAGALGIPMFAKGTNYAPGGLAIVGERGPELIQNRGGERIYNNKETMGILGGGKGSGVNFTLNVNGNMTSEMLRETKLQMSNQLRRVLNNR
jgi:hypothetical protein